MGIEWSFVFEETAIGCAGVRALWSRASGRTQGKARKSDSGSHFQSENQVQAPVGTGVHKQVAGMS